MTTFSGTRAFNSTWDALICTDFSDSSNICHPVTIIKINCKKIGRFIRQHRINTDYITALCIFSAQMAKYGAVIQWGITAVFAFRTLYLLHVTDTRLPFVGTNGRISGFSSVCILITQRIDILTPFEQGTKEGYFLVWRTMFCDLWHFGKDLLLCFK